MYACELNHVFSTPNMTQDLYGAFQTNWEGSQVLTMYLSLLSVLGLTAPIPTVFGSSYIFAAAR